MNKYKLSIFTPTYNRAYILPKLKESLLRQDVYDFEWLIIDDGSTDETESLVTQWQHEAIPFVINYYKTVNGGKPRAINKACELAQSEWLFIIDSDDFMVDKTVGFILSSLNEIDKCDDFVGIGFLQGHNIGSPLGQVKFEHYVDATNLQRQNYGLNFDCNEVYRISILRQFPFVVWPGELFTPEAVVMNEMALNGYKLRWYNKVCVISEYQPDGLTKGSNQLVKRNPMGFAMAYNHKLKYTKGISNRINITCQFIAHCLLAGELLYIAKCNNLFLAVMLFPCGFILFLRRCVQYRRI